VILLPVQEPIWNLELAWISHNHHEILKLCSAQLSSTVNIQKFRSGIGKEETNTTRIHEKLSSDENDWRISHP
jgi:hypothetical protein